MSLYRLLRPLLFGLEPERAHRLTLWALRHGLIPGGGSGNRAPVTVWGKTAPNPIGLAAGFDKNAEAIEPLFRLGFGLVEIGSVTPRPQPGNPHPRVFRLVQDRGVINRLGFNNEGVDAVERRLAAFRDKGSAPGLLGVNLGKNKDSPEAAPDYGIGAKRLAPYADYLVINVSSPNTPELRALQSHSELERIIEATREAMSANPVPLIVKIAPDLKQADKEEIAVAALDEALDGLIVSNTTVARPTNLVSPQQSETGGLSGRPLRRPSTALLAEMHRLTEGKILLIGTGGVSSPQDVEAKQAAGATLVQLYTGLVYKGPGLPARLVEALAADGTSPQQALP